MIKEENLKLISGIFNPDEAAQILFKLVKSKIDFHNLEIAHIKETGLGDRSKSEKRLEQLRSLETHLIDIIEQAKKEEVELEIESLINIKSKQTVN